MKSSISETRTYNIELEMSQAELDGLTGEIDNILVEIGRMRFDADRLPSSNLANFYNILMGVDDED